MKRAKPPPPIRYPKPAILQRIPGDGHVVIEASAGTGKTFTIERLVIDLVLAGAVMREFLILTYTEKAAAELRSRIRKVLEALLATVTHQCSDAQPHWLIDGEGRRRLEHALLEYDLATISTIHAFFRSILQSHPFHCQRALEQELVSNRSQFGQAFRTMLRGDFVRNPELRPVLDHWLASGSCEALEELLWQAFRRGRRLVPPYRPQALAQLLDQCSFPSMDDQALENIGLSLKNHKANPQTSTATLKRLDCLRESARQYRHDRELLRFLGNANVREAVQTLAANLCKNGVSEALGADLGNQIIALQELLVSPRTVTIQTLLPPLRERIDEEKNAHGYYDFDDMLSLVWQALDSCSDHELLDHLRCRYRYGIVDEFQDTDSLQWKIFEKIFVERDSPSRLFVIGDPKQAIYAFRGADVHTYLAARKQLVDECHAVQLPLSASFRSTAPMVDALNLIFRQDESNAFFTGAIKYDEPVTCGLADKAAHQSCKPGATPIRVFACGEPADRLSAYKLRRHFAERIAGEIRRLLFTKSAEARMRAKDIFILTATAREGDEIARHLAEHGIPFAFYKKDGLFDTPEAAEIRDLLAAVADPRDQSLRSLAWLTRFFAVPIEALPINSDVAIDERLTSLLEGWKLLSDQNQFAELFSSILNESGILRRELALSQSERSLTNYLHVFEILLAECQQHGCTLDELVRLLRAFIAGTAAPAGENSTVQRLETDRDAVQILTMHKSKGLESEVVFLFGGLSGGKNLGYVEYHQGNEAVIHFDPDPATKEKAQTERIEEHQRLLYVAATRAKSQLYLCAIPRAYQSKSGPAPYLALNKRLLHLLEECKQGKHKELIAIEPTRSPGKTIVKQRTSLEAEPSNLGDLLKIRLPAESAFDKLRQRHAAFGVTSYTRLKQSRGGYTTPLEKEEFKDDGTRFAPHWLSAQSLPGGPASGTFLHEVLEFLPLDTFRGRPELDTWANLEPVKQVFEVASARHGIARKYLSDSGRMIHATLTAEIRLGDDNSIDGLCSSQEQLREVEFLYPFPELDHPRLGSIPSDRMVIERGFVKGFVDFVFSWRGRVYFADWKSDVLPDFSEAAVHSHVKKNYSIQASLYSLALVKMLQVRSHADYEARFGGMIYCFLRGMPLRTHQDEAVFFLRPSWQNLLSYETELIQDPWRRVNDT